MVPPSASGRRSFLAGMGALALTPVLVRPALPTNPQAVVIGAGAAGIAATRALLERGIETVAIEAAGHIGGRAVTDGATFGVPWDVGAHWLHNGSRNPYNAYGRDNGFDIYPARDDFRVFAEGRELEAGEQAALWQAEQAIYNAIGAAAESGRDISAAEAAAAVTGPWKETAAFVIGPWGMGKDLDAFSTSDWWNSADGEDWFCRAGFGTLVAQYGAGLPVALETAATAIDWGGPGVKVETTTGTLRADAVVVTVSTGVLASGAIAFSPALPAAREEAFHAVSMGLYNHIALLFSHDVFAMGPDGYLLFRIGEDGAGFGVLTDAGGHGLAYCDVGGSWAAELEGWSEAARIDYALSTLKGLLGSGIEAAFVKGRTTSWGRNPLTLGSYASARPGAWPMRAKLRETLGERVFFAGEACHRDLWATVGGAHLSGVEAAEAVARSLA